MDKFKQIEKIVIYGLGDFGKRLYRFLASKQISIDFFCQTEKTCDEIWGVPVLSLSQLAKIDEKFVVLIAIGDKFVSRQIHLLLTSLFWDKIEIYECGEFISQNIPFSDDVRKEHYCIMCNNEVHAFEPGGINAGLFKEHHIIGGGYRKNMICPVCKGIDRERFELYILSKYTNIFVNKCRVLHFAPEPHISERIVVNSNCDYYMGDIAPYKGVNKVDVTDIHFKDRIFDYIIINHVLEHIIDEKKAITELKRVLMDEGKIILSFPICMDQKTIEDENAQTREERLHLFGQEDHVRLYGSDYKECLENYGLKVESHCPKDELSDKEIRKYGFIPDDIILICSKKIL